MNRTGIEWTTFSANPIKYRRKSDGKIVWGCVKTSSGCANCYSEAIALRFDRGKLFNARNMEELEPFLDEHEAGKMLRAKTISGATLSGSRCFIGDMTDVFGEWVPDDLLSRLFSQVLETRTDVVWQLLTKRASRMCEYLSWRWGEGRIPARNIHVGVSVEDQARADERIPHLLRTPAAVRFLSCEPLLAPVDLTRCYTEGTRFNAFQGQYCGLDGWGSLDWVIVGGESGPRARPIDVTWVRSLVGQCRAAGVACFVKQLGSRSRTGPVDAEGFPRCWRCGHFDFGPCGDGTLLCNGCNAAWDRLRDPKGGDPSEWPKDLRVREFPR